MERDGYDLLGYVEHGDYRGLWDGRFVVVDDDGCREGDSDYDGD